MPSTTKRCNVVRLGRHSVAAQSSTPTTPEGEAGGAIVAPETCRWNFSLSGPAGVGKVHEGTPSTANVGCISALMPGNELPSLAPPQPKTSGVVCAMVHVPPLSDGEVLQQLLRPAVTSGIPSVCSRPLQASKAVFRLDSRCFSTEKEPADTTSDDNSTTKSRSGLAETSSAKQKAPKQPKASIPRKRRTTKSERTPSSPPPAADAAAAVSVAQEATAEPTGASKSNPPAVEIPASRKAAFERARRAGVSRRIKEGGGVPRDASSTSSTSTSRSSTSRSSARSSSASSSTSSTSSGNGAGVGGDDGDGFGSVDASTFQWQEAITSSQFTWKEPGKPVLPEGFPAGSGIDGRESRAVAGGEADVSSANASGGKASYRCHRHVPSRDVWLATAAASTFTTVCAPVPFHVGVWSATSMGRALARAVGRVLHQNAGDVCTRVALKFLVVFFVVGSESPPQEISGTRFPQ